MFYYATHETVADAGRGLHQRSSAPEKRTALMCSLNSLITKGMLMFMLTMSIYLCMYIQRCTLHRPAVFFRSK